MKPVVGDQLYWLIAVPNTPRESGDQILSAQQKKLPASDAKAYRFPVKQDLRVGTLDALMSLSDDMMKVDVFVETVTRKLARQIYDLTDPADLASGRPILAVNSAQPDHYLTHFQWDEAKYPTKATLRDLTNQISTETSKIDEELRTKAGEYQSTLTVLNAADRRDAGNLMVRNLGELVNSSHVTYTEHITTLFVVVPKYSQAEWFSTYESLCQFVVPRSSQIIKEDPDLVLVNVKLFKNFVDEVKGKCREKKWTVRDFTFDEKSLSTQESEKKRLQESRTDQQRKLLSWCRGMFAECFTSWTHIKCIRVFVESVLRYGLPPNFTATLVQIVRKANDKKVRETLDTMYKGLGGKNSFDSATDKDDGAEDFFSYVCLSMNLDMKPTATS